jgi:hypothetical protein
MIFYFWVIPKVLQFFPKKRDMKLVEFTPPKNQKQKKTKKTKKQKNKTKINPQFYWF